MQFFWNPSLTANRAYTANRVYTANRGYTERKKYIQPTVPIQLLESKRPIELREAPIIKKKLWIFAKLP